MSAHTILIVEDNPDNRQLVRFILEREGYRILEAPDGLKGVAMVRQYMPDLVLLDLAIPKMDGWDVAVELQADPMTKHIPLVAMSAMTLPKDKRKAMELGCAGFIEKPLEANSFAKEVGQYLVFAE